MKGDEGEEQEEEEAKEKMKEIRKNALRDRTLTKYPLRKSWQEIYPSSNSLKPKGWQRREDISVKNYVFYISSKKIIICFYP